MATVYIVQDDSQWDLSDARRYGALHTVFTDDIPPGKNVNERVTKATQHAFDVLCDFVPGEDYLCLVGSPLYMSLCSYVLGDLGLHPIKLLRYDRRLHKYYEVVVQ